MQIPHEIAKEKSRLRNERFRLMKDVIFKLESHINKFKNYEISKSAGHIDKNITEEEADKRVKIFEEFKNKLTQEQNQIIDWCYHS